jgi:hypothetical protein
VCILSFIGIDTTSADSNEEDMEANTNGNQGLKKEGYYNLKTCCCPLPNTLKAENGIADLVDKPMTAKKGRPGN